MRVCVWPADVLCGFARTVQRHRCRLGYACSPVLPAELFNILERFPHAMFIQAGTPSRWRDPALAQRTVCVGAHHRCGTEHLLLLLRQAEDSPRDGPQVIR